ncbi:pre-mRNA-splicing ATP-dependent RNA helicase prp28 [Phakopsora pachyrhizi]|uniref:RNA helicase n=1 Tax=Phakopsora pachyrhizi TaxID=170000 RepID=A0AAV0ALE5_PHAPC|nr:pre-mRNA-splicing ATP-dependent RNA helicase prp28 [Phakopsora pachyrhizi]CAH7668788.1 pre-mRNA-splicing ATP-dependent RNA helicase prp28 [Phakopsora pachyrhizi]
MGMGPSPGVRLNGTGKESPNPNGRPTSNGPSKQPLSIETLLAQQKAEKEAANKPKFLSKEERAALAIAKRQQEVAAQKARLSEAASRREELERNAREARYGSYPSRGGGSRGGSNLDSGSQAYSYNDRRGSSGSSARTNMDGIPTAPKALRGKSGSGPGTESSLARPSPLRNSYQPETTASTNSFAEPSASSSMPPPTRPASATLKTLQDGSLPSMEPMIGTAEPPILNQKLLMARYLGQPDNKKRRIRKMSDKKFVFDWAKDEDTALEEVDPLYAVAAPPAPTQSNNHYSGNGRGNSTPPSNTSTVQVVGRFGLYGNGKLAGIDPAVQTNSSQSRYSNRTNLDPDDQVLTSTPVQLGSIRSSAVINELHWSQKPLESMRDRDWRIFREDFSIAARGGNIPNPMRSWDESKIPLQILEIIDEVGYKEPSPIQRQAIPLGLNNRDLIGIAETGSGKTASFVIPMLTYIGKLPPLSDDNRHLGPYALILAPTRELAQQIEGETNKFALRLGYRCVSIVGGKAMEEQALNMRDGAEIIIATPGRLKDCIERHVLVLSQCTYVVMDEADRMINLGFEEVVNFILDQLPLSNLKPDTEEAEDSAKMTSFIGGIEGFDLTGVKGLYRQTVMFSATMPPAVERLARKYLRRPAVVTIGVAGQAVDTVDQQVEFLPNEDKKRGRLLEVLNQGHTPPIIVFVNQKKTADQLAKDISRAGWSTTTLHSGKNQEQREAALASLRSGESDILVATDLAGRGIDVPDVSLVVNFQMAGTIEAYVHRIGRTGRAGKVGTAITFLTNDDADVMYDLKQEIMKSPVSRCPPELAKHEAAQSKMSAAMKRRAADLDEG